MSMRDMFVEKAILSGADKAVVDSILRKAPFVGVMPTMAANKGRANVYEETVDIDALPQTELDAPLVSINATSKLGQANLFHLSAKQDIGVGKLNELGISAPEYFASKAAKVFGRTAQGLERTFINQIRDTAVAVAKKTGTEFTGKQAKSLAGSTSNSQFSISIVTFAEGEVTGLYNPTGFGDMGMFDVSQVGGGTRLDANNVEQYTYAYRMDAGFQIANPKYATTIVNIENAADLVGSITTAKLDYWLSVMLERAFPEEGNTLIVMSPALLTAINHAFKVNDIRFASEIANYETRLSAWDGIPILTSRNILSGTEAVISGL